MSNELCCTADAANFCAAAHADAAWRASASAASADLLTFMATLNTNPVLWGMLERTMAGAEAAGVATRAQQGWTAEEFAVGRSLLAEFQQAGLGMGTDVARQYRALKQEEERLSRELAAWQAGGGGGAATSVRLSDGLAAQHRLRTARGPPRFAARGSRGDAQPAQLTVHEAERLRGVVRSEADRRVLYQVVHTLPVRYAGCSVCVSTLAHGVPHLNMHCYWHTMAPAM